MKKLAVFGAGGHGKVVAEIAELSGWEQVVFFDDRWPNFSKLERWSVVGNGEMLLARVDDYDAVFVAIGNNQIRLEKASLFEEAGGLLVTLVHPKAVISPDSHIGRGSVVMANAVINPFVSIGKASIINTSATIDHDCTLHTAVHISPGANLAGGVNVGQFSWVGMGSSIIELIHIGSHVIVGAGSVVIHDISNETSVVGSPARRIKHN